MKKKTVVITGASKGLGNELAQIFYNANYNLILCGWKTENYPEMKKTFTFQKQDPGEIIRIRGDITLLDTKESICDAIRTMGGIDVLINNAAVYRNVGFQNSNYLNYIKDISVNLLTPMILTRILWNKLKETKGLVLNINSIAGKVGAKDEFIYCATKHGLKGFSDSIQFDATEAGIRVISAYLGAMQTDMTRDNPNRDNLMKTEEVADFIYKTITDYKSMRITEIDICRRNY